MANIFEKAWGNYTAMINFLLNADKDTLETEHGIFQSFDLATLLSYSKGKNNYNNFLLDNLSNFVAPTKIVNDKRPSDDKFNYPIKLENAYRDFLNEFNDYLLENLDATTNPSAAELQKYKLKLQDAQTDYQNYQTTVNDKWVVFAESQKIPQDQLEDRRIIWERDGGYSEELERKRSNIRAANALINAFIKKHTSKDIWPLLDAVTYWDDPNFQVQLPINPQYDDITKKSYWRSFRWQFPILDLDEFLANDNNISNTFKTESQDYSRVETKWNAKASFGWGIFSGGGSVQKRTLEEISKNSEFEFQISFKRFQNIEIFRDKWFQDVLFTTIGKKFKAYWGPGGLMAAIPYSIVLARGTKIIVKMSDDYKRAFESFIDSGGSFGFGPFFSIGGGYSKDEKYMNFHSTNEGFELSDNDTTVRVIGCCIKRFNWSEQEAKEYSQILTEESIAQIASKTPNLNLI